VGVNPLKELKKAPFFITIHIINLFEGIKEYPYAIQLHLENSRIISNIISILLKVYV